MDKEPEPLVAEFRHHGRLYRAVCAPNGRTEIFRDGTWVCAGNWNRRALDIGRNDLTFDVAEDLAIAEALSDGLAEALAAHPERLLDPRTRT